MGCIHLENCKFTRENTPPQSTLRRGPCGTESPQFNQASLGGENNVIVCAMKKHRNAALEMAFRKREDMMEMMLDMVEIIWRQKWLWRVRKKLEGWWYCKSTRGQGKKYGLNWRQKSIVCQFANYYNRWVLTTCPSSALCLCLCLYLSGETNAKILLVNMRCRAACTPMIQLRKSRHTRPWLCRGWGW